MAGMAYSRSTAPKRFGYPSQQPFQTTRSALRFLLLTRHTAELSFSNLGQLALMATGTAVSFIYIKSLKLGFGTKCSRYRIVDMYPGSDYAAHHERYLQHATVSCFAADVTFFEQFLHGNQIEHLFSQ